MTLVVNLVRTASSAKFICYCWRHPRYDCHVTPTPKCSESAKTGQIINCVLTILTVCFPCAAYELRHSSDLSLLTKCPVFYKTHLATLHMSTNLNGKLRKKLGGQTRGQAKIWGGMAHPGPLRISTANLHWEVARSSRARHDLIFVYTGMSVYRLCSLDRNLRDRDVVISSLKRNSCARWLLAVHSLVCILTFVFVIVILFWPWLCSLLFTFLNKALLRSCSIEYCSLFRKDFVHAFMAKHI